MQPYVADPDFTLYVGDALSVLRDLPDQHVQTVVTSPPYFGLRDYGTAEWEGGDSDCDHQRQWKARDERPAGRLTGGRKTVDAASMGHRQGIFRDECGRCGAARIDAQLGLEHTPGEYVDRMVEVFREVRRVLRDDGTLWLNIGDSYNTNGGHASAGATSQRQGRANVDTQNAVKGANVDGLRQKNLLGIPWRLAFALQDDGWILRSEIIWAKPNPMPESVTDRPTKAHEQIFLLAKSGRYYYDADAIREDFQTSYAPDSDSRETLHESLPPESPRGPDGRRKTTVTGGDGSAQHRDGERWPERPQARRARELFAEAGLTEAHLDAIRAVGITDVGKAQVTQTGHGKNLPEAQALADEAKAALGGYYREFLTPSAGRNKRSVWEVVTQPYPGAHFAVFPEALIEPCVLAGAPEGGLVLDPFAGAGTTAYVARRLGRRSVGIELNPEYAELIALRLSQQSLLADSYLGESLGWPAPDGAPVEAVG